MFKAIASVKTTLIASAVALTIGVGVGVWMTNKFYAFGKINMLESYIDRQAASHKLTIENLSVVHQKKLKIAEDSIKIKMVNVYVKDNRACDLTADAVRLLDNSRTGMPTAAAGTDKRVPEPPAITQRQQIASCARDGIQYRELKTTYDGLKQFLVDNWQKK